ncbi:hypothetical protein [Wolbachia endosymbiont of Ctenocephalides felis wCfeJ]|uniref:hypothetical protein n=1 Tax=Wolbachia endosymbiont of Ctenocephalides felis wCfeJ TaxID=2732594 RepID=UPI001445BBF1|nr:hypothetical protein [Wolbachia endosymbiont of Ctenocephalides felis wCfeJ]WCR58413.1 MAG: hypothetical protein PG980_000885 [Wolbachia endosymbiont of Ctenocephalides felis wCfeJ]
MKLPKKVKKAIVKKLRNLKDIAAPKETATQGPSVSSGRKLSPGPEKPLEDVLNTETTIEQQTLSPTATVDAAVNIETNIVESCENSDITTIEDQAASLTASVDETPNASDNLSLAETKPCFDNSTANEQEKPLPKATQQRRAIVAGLVGVVLLANSLTLYILKMHVIAVVGGIVGLVCLGFALYNAIKPSTKLEKIEDMEQPVTAYPPLNRA